MRVGVAVKRTPTAAPTLVGASKSHPKHPKTPTRGSGVCLDGVCKCSTGWTGPSCLARLAGAARVCKPLELKLRGGGPCFVNSTTDNCGRGCCVAIDRKWDAPWQTVQGSHGFKPVGTGDGRCECLEPFQGPFCNLQGACRTES